MQNNCNKTFTISIVTIVLYDHKSQVPCEFTCMVIAWSFCETFKGDPLASVVMCFAPVLTPGTPMGCDGKQYANVPAIVS